jgi:tocopherol cyclase
MLKSYIETTLHPERYHGHGKRAPFFEGWYYKLIDAAENHRFAIIPGIFLGNTSSNTHAFVQVLDGMTGKATYHAYPVEAFQAAEGAFDVCVGPNRFSDRSVYLDINDAERTLRGEVHFDGIKPWPVTWTSPGIMGWYGWLSFMECYHGVVSLDHALHGSFEIDGEWVDFAGGRGYIEKDWGQAFPSAYIWMQTNHFEQPRTSLTASIAMIPFGRFSFRGQIVGLWHDSTLYRFAKYTNAIVEKLAVSDSHVDWVLRDSQYRLEMQAERTEGSLLLAPIRTEMHKRVNETLKSNVQVRLTALQNNRAIFEGVGRNAGLEVHGDLPTLLNAK